MTAGGGQGLGPLGEILNRILALEQAQANLVRVGIVISVDEEGHRVKCRIPAADNIRTGWLQVLTSRARYDGAGEYDPPGVGEQGPCLFLAPGLETGFYLGSVFSHSDPPPVTDRHKWRKQIAEGAYIEFDTKEQKAIISIPEDWTLHLGEETEEAKKVARVGDRVYVSFGSSAGYHKIVDGSERVRAAD